MSGEGILGLPPPPGIPEPMAWGVLLLTAAVLALLLPFAAHRLHLLRMARLRGRPSVSGGEGKVGWEGSLPAITVQLPLYNEAAVVERLVDAAAALDYPAHLLEIQILDDSSDDTVERARARVEAWQRRGVRVRHLRRPEREGYKAGALQWGMERAEGEFILILDADFVPDPGLLRRLLPPFRDPEVGMVQARWDHLNEEASLLTRCQALLLDAHFFLEQGGRHAAGHFMNFNGTAGMWRRETLEEAGGWSADTLTEDLDVSYRAQMAGWRFVFLPEVGVPAELPEEVRALEVQQKRWAQGGVQTGRKLLGRLWRGPWPLPVKLEGTIHLLGHVAHPLTLLLGVLLFPSALARDVLGLREFLVLDLVIFALATLSFLTFYLSAGRMRRRPWRRVLPTAVLTLALGIGLTASVSRSVLRGLVGGGNDPFLRTPKRGDGPGPRYRSPSVAGDTLLKGVLLVWMVFCIVLALGWGYFGSLPFLLLFAGGWGWLGLGGLSPNRPAGPPASEPLSIPSHVAAPSR